MRSIPARHRRTRHAVRRPLSIIAVLALIGGLVTVTAGPASADTVTITNVAPTETAVTVTWNQGPAGSGSTLASSFHTATYTTDPVANNLPLPTTNTQTTLPDTTGRQFTLTGLTGNTNYWVRITGTNSGGTAATSRGDAVQAFTTLPGAPTAVTASAVPGQPTQLSVAFTAPGGNGTITTYQYSTDGGATWKNRTSGTTASPLVISQTSAAGTNPLVANTTYNQIRIRAVNSTGAGTASGDVTGTTVPAATTLTGGLANVAGTASTLGDGSLARATLSATQPGNASVTYRYSTDGGSTFPGTVTVDGTTLTLTGLSPNTSYTQIRVRAENVGGAGAANGSNLSVTTTPGAPTGLAASAVEDEPNQLSVSFTAATGGGANAITNYEFSTNNGTNWTAISPADATSPVIITGLAADTAYPNLRLRAVTAAGAGTQSASFSGSTVASAPSISSITGLSTTQLTVAFAPPAAGTPTTYQYSTDGGTSWRTRTDAQTTTSPMTIAGTSATNAALTANTAYDVRIRAVTASGNGDSSPLVVGTTLAGAPTSVVGSGVTGDGSWGRVEFTAPGGSATITGYEVSINGGTTWIAASGTTSPLTFPSLTPNTAYSGVLLRALNAGGAGVASAPFNLTTTPGAPTVTAITGEANDLSHLLVFATPAVGGGALEPVGYSYSLDGGSTWATAAQPAEVGAQADAQAGAQAVITGLQGNTLYDQIRIRTITTAGAGTSTAANASGTTVPAPPTAVVASQVASTTQLSVSYTAPGGAQPIFGYQYSLNNGATWQAGVLSGNPLTITGLVSNTTYDQLRIRALNSEGTGLGEASVTVSATTRAAAPTALSATGQSPTSVAVAFTAPAGAATTTYKYSTDNGATWKTRTTGTTASPLVITETSAPGSTPLTADTDYQVKLLAVNAGGDGVESSTVSATTLPTAPTDVVATAVVDDGSALSVSFGQAERLSNTSLSYEFSINNGSTWLPATGTSSPILLTGLTGDTTYSQLRLRAVNDGGAGESSATFSGTTTPGMPTIVTATGTDTDTISVVFTAPSPSTGVTSYEYSTDGSTWKTRTDGGGVSSPLVITQTSAPGSDPLVAGTQYELRIAAVNGQGRGTPSAMETGTTLADGPVITTLTASRVESQDRLTAAFVPVSGADAYQYSTDGTTWKTRTDGGGLTSPLVITETSASGTNPLAANTNYTVRLRALTMVEDVPVPGAEGAPVTRATLPPAPTSVEATAVAGNSSRLSVAYSLSGGNATITAVQFSTDGGETWQAAIGTTSPVVITGLAPNATASGLLLRAVNDSGNGIGDASEGFSGTTVAGAPTITDALTGTTQTQLSIAFDAPSPATGITTYQYSTDGGNSWKTRTTGTTGSPVVITEESSSSSDLTPFTAYQVKLRAVTSAGQGDPSATTAISTLVGPPEQLSELSATTSTVTIIGNRPEPSTGFVDIEYSTDNGATWRTRDSGGVGQVVISVTSDTDEPLVSNTVYNTKLRYITLGGGRGEASATIAATTAAVAPVVSSVVGENSTDPHLVVSLTQPDGANGATIVGYQYALDGGDLYPEDPDVWYPAVGAGSTIVLQLGDNPLGEMEFNTLYTVRVRALNASGAGEASSPAVNTATPAQPPTALAVTAASATSLNVSFTAPAGLATTAYDYSVNGGTSWTTRNSTDSSFTISGLAAGTPYSVRVRARNIGGPGQVSSVVNTATTTAAPTAVSGVAANGGVTVRWTAPAAGSGAGAITNYVVQYSSNGGETWTTWPDGPVTATTVTVTGLTPGTSYLFRVAAVNGGGTSSSSAPSSAAVPFTTPAKPTISGVTAGNGSVAVAWTPNPITGEDAGWAFTSVQVTASPGGATCVAGPSAGTCTVTGLTNGTAYTFVAETINAAGRVASDPSSSATPVGPPSIPTAVSGTPGTGAGGSGKVTVSWAAPVSDGGAAVTGYTVTASPGGATCSATAPGTSCVVEGLTNGTGYRFSVTATNGTATSNPSALTPVVTPRTVPGAPTVGTPIAGNGQVLVPWTAPVSDGGAAITSYTVTASPGGATCSTAGSGRSCTVSGLTVGEPYTFTVTATNAAGTGGASSATSAVEPLAVPVAPTNLTGTAGDSQVSLSWTAPTNTGSSAITDYLVEYSSTAGAIWTTFDHAASTATSIIVTGLANGTSYVFRVSAVNSTGPSAPSTSTAGLTPNAAVRPTNLAADRTAVGVGEDITITVTGDNLFDGATASSANESRFTVTPGSAEDGSITVTLSGLTAGVANLVLTNPGGGGTGTLGITVTPTLSNLVVTTSPAALAQGATRTFTIAGTGLQAGATVSVDGTGVTAGTPTVSTNGPLSVALTAAAEAGTGTRTLTITNPDGATATVNISVTAKPTASLATTPSAISTGATNTQLTISGTGFQLGALVTVVPGESQQGSIVVNSASLGTQSSTSFDGTSFVVNVTVSADATPGPWVLRITNPDGGVVTTSIDVVEILSVTSVVNNATSQASAAQGTVVQITITGSGFRPSAGVVFSGSGVRPSAVRVVDANTITATLTVSASAAATVRNVTVINPDSTRFTLSPAFTVLSGA